MKSDRGEYGESGSDVELTETCRERDNLRDEVVDTRIQVQTFKSNIQVPHPSPPPPPPHPSPPPIIIHSFNIN